MLKDSQLRKDFLSSWQIRQHGIIKGPAPMVFMKLFPGVKHPPCGGLSWLQLLSPTKAGSGFPYKPLIYWNTSNGVKFIDSCDMSSHLGKTHQRPGSSQSDFLLSLRTFISFYEIPSSGSIKAIVATTLGEVHSVKYVSGWQFFSVNMKFRVFPVSF